MLGQTIAMDRYPWFWSDQYGQNVQMVGSVIESEDRVELPATNASRIILYLRGAQVTGAVGINAGRDIRLIKRQLESGPPIDAYAIAKSGLPLQEAIKI
jgi:NADPH-dependent 2,4-dienoyl-CoA reductase/sulfur reductase-like enzyme